MTIFDTDTFTHYSKGNAKIRERMDQVDEGEEFAVTLVTRMEVLRGRFDSILKAANEAQMKTAIERFRASEEMLMDFRLVFPDEVAAGHFERLRVLKKLNKMRRPDLLIACIALTHRARLVTGNTKDYKDVPGLDLDNWTK